MKTYALIVDSQVIETFPPIAIDGIDIPIEARFHPDFVAQLVEINPDEHPVADAPETPA